MYIAMYCLAHMPGQVAHAAYMQHTLTGKCNMHAAKPEIFATSLFWALGHEPLLNNKLTVDSQPARAARCSAVLPFT